MHSQIMNVYQLLHWERVCSIKVEGGRFFVKWENGFILLISLRAILHFLTSEPTLKHVFRIPIFNMSPVPLSAVLETLKCCRKSSGALKNAILRGLAFAGT